MNEMTPEQFRSLASKVDMVLSEIKEIKDWQAKVDRGIEGEPVHGNPSYIERIQNNKHDIRTLREDLRQAHMRIDRIVYTAVGAGAGTGGVVAGVMKLILGV